MGRKFYHINPGKTFVLLFFCLKFAAKLLLFCQSFLIFLFTYVIYAVGSSIKM